MRTIALEEHIGTPKIAAASRATGKMLSRKTPDRVVEKLRDVGAGRLADMDAAGIDLQVLSATGIGLDKLDRETGTTLARESNDALAGIVRARPDRFAAFALLAMQDPEEAASEEIAGSLATSAWGWHVETGLHSLRLVVAGVFDRFPTLQVIIGHMGENLPFSLARADARLAPFTTHLQRRVKDYFLDATLGILSSRIHCVWALAKGGRMGFGNDPRYNASLTFETFPFPPGFDLKTNTTPEGEPFTAIAEAAANLDTWREKWLNPEGWLDWEITPEEQNAGFPPRPVPKPEYAAAWKKRTLTNLYNEIPAGLKLRQEKLDRAVAAAYGWEDYTPDMTDADILHRLLALNLERAKAVDADYGISHEPC